MKFEFIEPQIIDAEASALLLKYYGRTSPEDLPFNPEVILWEYLEPEFRLGLDDEQSLGIDKNTGDEILGEMDFSEREIRIDSGLKVPESVGRFNFTLAHEIGHWVLHRHYFLKEERQMDLFDGQTNKLVTLNRNLDPNSTSGKLPPEEWQANRFAASLLVDKGVLGEEFFKRFTREDCDFSKQSRRFPTMKDYSLFLTQKVKRGLPSLVDVFAVSSIMMAIRLVETGYVFDGRGCLF